jgi:hypothetical protein
MWLFTKIGFYSIVQHHEDPNIFLIRARAEKDLINLKNEVLSIGRRKIHTSEDRDYFCRVFVDRTELYEIMSHLIALVNYTNFKNEVAKQLDQKDKMTSYHRVWSAMFDYQYEILRKITDLYKDVFGSKASKRPAKNNRRKSGSNNRQGIRA